MRVKDVKLIKTEVQELYFFRKYENDRNEGFKSSLFVK